MSNKIINSQLQNSVFATGELQTKARVIDGSRQVQLVKEVDPDYSNSFTRYTTPHARDSIYLNPEENTTSFGSELSWNIPNDMAITEMVVVFDVSGVNFNYTNGIEKGTCQFINTVQLMHGNNTLESFTYYTIMRDIVNKFDSQERVSGLSYVINQNLSQDTTYDTIHQPLPLFFSSLRAYPNNYLYPAKPLLTYLSNTMMKLRIRLNPNTVFANGGTFNSCRLLILYEDIPPEKKAFDIARSKADGYLIKSDCYLTQPQAAEAGPISSKTLNFNFATGDIKEIGFMDLNQVDIASSKVYNILTQQKNITSLKCNINGVLYNEIKNRFTQSVHQYFTGNILNINDSYFTGNPVRICFAPYDSSNELYTGGLVMSRINSITVDVVYNAPIQHVYYLYAIQNCIYYLDSKSGLFNKLE